MTYTHRSLVVPRESLAPWLAASLLAAGAYTVGIAVGSGGSLTQRVLLTIGLCAVVSSTQLVLLRSRRLEHEVREAERARPATEELGAWILEEPLVKDDGDGHLPPYAEGMLRYSGAVLGLFEHAVAVALDIGLSPDELVAARDDAAALHNLLSSMSNEPVHLDRAAKVHTICSLWEANQSRCERLAADLDPDFHRRWRARHLAAIRLRHGDRPRRDDPALPYRDMTE
jgi:hypothetical protein